MMDYSCGKVSDCVVVSAVLVIYREIDKWHDKKTWEILVDCADDVLFNNVLVCTIQYQMNQCLIMHWRRPHMHQRTD